MTNANSSTTQSGKADAGSCQFELQTDRLRLLPLNRGQLLAYLQNDGSLEAALKLQPSSRILSEDLADALRQTLIPGIEKATDNHLFHTLWTMIDEAANQMVGDICFKCGPNERGEVEIGYGTYDSFQRRRYMKEAIVALTTWAFQQPDVRVILAETESGNFASHKVLQHAGFIAFTLREGMIWWRLEKIQTSQKIMQKASMKQALTDLIIKTVCDSKTKLR